MSYSSHGGSYRGRGGGRSSGGRGGYSRGRGRSSGGSRFGRGGGRSRGGSKNNFGIRRDQIGGKLIPVDWQRVGLKEFKKCFWTNPPNLAKAHLIQQWRTSAEVYVEGQNIPDPIITFQESNFPSGFLNTFHQLGFTAPTPIQSQGWPMALTGRDIVGIAETGSGKTLAFVLPGIIHIQGQVPSWGREGPICLVVAPTRELAIQIEQETQKYTKGAGINVAVCYGGAPRRRQEAILRRGVEFLIATPGRLLDFLERRVISLHRCSYVVFDEADRMLDMGFEPQIRALMSQVRPDRQVLMWSATWPKEVQKLAWDYLPNDRLKLKIGDENKAAANVTQVIEVISRQQKPLRLKQILQIHSQDKILIFCGTKRMADQLGGDLYNGGFKADSIHGDKEQWKREQILGQFRQNQLQILVATDVASRGIDVKDLSLVINYDFPQNCEDYIHRVGRTGRAGASGTAITFFDAKMDGKHARKLCTILEKNIQDVPATLQALRYGGGRRYSNGGRNGGYRSRGRGRGRGGGRGGGRGRGRGRFNPY